MSLFARRAGLGLARRSAASTLTAPKRAFASEAAAALSGPSFKLNEDQEAYQGALFWMKNT